MKNKRVKEFLVSAIDKMFEIAEVDMTYDKVIELNDTEWFLKYTWNSQQEKEWLDWLEKEIKRRKLVTTRKLARKEANWFNLCYGLKVI